MRIAYADMDYAGRAQPDGSVFNTWPAGFRWAVGDVTSSQAVDAKPRFRRHPRAAAMRLQHVEMPEQTGFRGGRKQLSGQAGKAKKAEKVEGKIEETGTPLARFRKLLLSAHWLGAGRAAPRFLRPRAAGRRKALALLGFERHHRPESGVFSLFAAGQRP